MFVNTDFNVLIKNIFIDFLVLIIYNKNTKRKGGKSLYSYKMDILKELSKRGYTSTRMRKEKILSEATMQNLRKGKGITTDTINTICIILRCQPSDIIEIVPTDEEKIKYF